MSNALAVRPLVRPVFLKWSIVVFVLLVPFVVHSIWDYTESMRLARNIAAIRVNHEPASAYEINPRPRVFAGERAAAERLYLAAGVLAESDGEMVPGRLAQRTEEAARTGTWPDELVRDMRRRVSEREDAFRLLDRAAHLAHAGFAPRSRYGNRTGDLTRLAWLARLRTRLLAIDGRGDAAADALYSELRIVRTLEPLWGMSVVSGAITNLVAVLEQGAAKPESLLRVDSALAEIDRDDLLRNQLLFERATLLDNMNVRSRWPGPEWIVRPWLLQMTNWRLELMALQIEAANRPWPRKLDVARQMYSANYPAWWKRADEGRVEMIVRGLALIRCARVAIAVSRYRDDRRRAPAAIEDLVPQYLSVQPIDPFSGKPLGYRVQPDYLAISSAGANRVGGRDVGLRIRLR